MAQTILNLITNNSIADGVYISIKETIDGVETNVPYRVHGHNLHENSEDSVMLVRQYAPVSRSMHSENTTIYEGCEMDTWLNETWVQRYSAEMLACMLTANIKILTAENEAYGIARKIFIPSFSEWGYTGGVVDGLASPYTTTNEKRKVYSESGSAVITWLRSRYSVAQYRCVITHGSAGNSNATYGGYWALPAFDLPSSLSVADTANDDGSYNLIVPDVALPGVDFSIKVDESATQYDAVKVSIAVEGATEQHLYVCNNYLDDAPTWEDATSGTAHAFTNATKTADTWALGVRVHAIGEQTVTVHEPFIMWTLKG